MQNIMTRQEFNERTGYTLNEEQYREVEAMYMAAGNMNKDVFCKDYKKHQSCRKVERETAELLIGKAHTYNDTDFRRAAIRLIGEREVVLITIAMGLPLFEEDAEYIKNNIR